MPKAKRPKKPKRKRINPKDFKSALEKAISLNKCVILDVVTDVDALAPLAYI